MKQPLKCLAVDDESLARKLLEENIRQLPFLELVATCKNPFEAMEAMQNQRIDLLFLDIQMPGMLGTQFLQSLPQKPMVIFVTAYSNYAVESYEMDVVDYLMKPVSLERFTKAAYKALQRHEQRTQPQPAAMPAVLADDVATYMFINVEYAMVKVVFKDILFIEGLKDYVKIHLEGQSRPILTKSTMKGIEERLPPKDFLRVHKSYIIQLAKVEAIRGKNLTIQKHEIPISNTSHDELLNLLKI